jgi:hypothetical protein
MNYSDMMKQAMRGELRKIAFSRIGRKPIGIDRLLERESESQETPSNVFGKVDITPEQFQADIEKVSGIGKSIALMGVGSLGTLGAQKANNDRKMGKMMRMQQQQGY